MFIVTNYQRSANQNYYEVSPHTRQNGHHLKPTRNAGEGVEKREPSYTVGGNVGAATGKQYGSASQNYHMIHQSYSCAYTWTKL